MRRSIGIVLRWFIPVIACFGLGVASAPAQTYPVKPIRLIFGYTAGGAGDVGARLLAQKLSENLGQNVVVENRPGAGGAIADELVAKSPADGYTLLYAAGSTTILPALRPKLPYSVERDFAPVSMVMITSFALAVHPSVPVNDVKGLIALARSQPGKLTFSTPGVGSSSHFAGEVFKMMADVKMLHVPYRGAPEATTAVIAGEVDINFPSVTGALPFVKTGRLRKQREACADAALRAYAQRERADRLRARRLERRAGACRRSQGNHRAAECGDHQGSQHARDEGSDRQAGPGGTDRHTGGVCRFHSRPARAEREGGQVRRHQDGIGERGT